MSSVQIPIETSLEATQELQGDDEEKGGEAGEEEGEGCPNVQGGGEETGIYGVPVEEHLGTVSYLSVNVRTLWVRKWNFGLDFPLSSEN